MKITIDRFEENFAIVELENKATINMPIQLIPAGAVEGDILVIDIDLAATENRKEKVEKMCKDLWE